MWIYAIVGQHNRLCVLQLVEYLRLKYPVPLEVVALGRADCRSMRRCASGENADAGILVVLRQAIAELQLFLLSTKFAGNSHAEVIAEGKEDLRAERLQESPPGFPRKRGS